MPKQASDIANGIDGEKPPPGLRSVASATGTPPSMSSRAGAKRPELQVERGDGQQRGDDAGLLHRVDAARRDVEQVVGRSRAHLGGHQRAAALREFVGMDARLQAVAHAGLEDLLRFLGREDAGLAEDVAPLGEPVARRGRDHLPHELVDVEAPVRAVLDGDLVGAHEGRDQFDRVLGARAGG